MPQKRAESIVKGLCFSGFSTEGYLVRVDVADDKITRIRPLNYEWQYRREELPYWHIEAPRQGLCPPA